MNWNALFGANQKKYKKNLKRSWKREKENNSLSDEQNIYGKSIKTIYLQNNKMGKSTDLQYIFSQDFKSMYQEFYKDQFTITEFTRLFKEFYKEHENDDMCFEDRLQLYILNRK